MLSKYDADLARRDTAIPSLTSLLDPEAFRAVASEATNVEITGAWPSYVRYKPGMNCLVAYELEVAGQRIAAYAKGHRADASDQLTKAEQRGSVPGPLGTNRNVIADQAIVLSVFPNDAELKTLMRFSDPEAWSALLKRIFPEREELWAGTIKPIRYKPERRYVAQLLVANEPRALLKVYTTTGFSEAKSSAGSFKSRGVLSVPRRIGHSDRHQVLAFEWMQGRLLSEAMSDPYLGPDAIEQVGMALAQVHAGRPGKLAHLTREAEASGLLSVAAGVGFLCPELRGRVQDLAREIALTLMREPAANVAIHGDFYAKQVLLQRSASSGDGGGGGGGGDRVVILDFDSAAIGDPAADLGLFIAHLERGALRRSLPPEKVHPYAEALLDGYARATGHTPPDRVRLYTAASLLRLSPHPFRNRDPHWPQQIEATVARAEQIFHSVTGRAFYLPGINQANPSVKHEPAREAKALALALSVESDPTMPFMAQALNPFDVQLQFSRHLRRWLSEGSTFEVTGIRVVRHKRGRRCLVEYDLLVDRPGEPTQAITLLGKVRARGLDRTTAETLRALSNAGFGHDAKDGISVPELVGLVPEFQMGLHRKVPGTLATQLLAEKDGKVLAGRIAEALYKLHSTPIKCSRRHTVRDEMVILHQKLPLVAISNPAWDARIRHLLQNCDRLSARLPAVALRGIHRDFYADHVLQDGKRLYLLDFDLYCLGDPALDIGNFVAHMQEWALRSTGDLNSLADVEAALIERYLELSPGMSHCSIEIYTLLALARHVYLSTQFPDRRRITEALLDACELKHGSAQSIA